MITFGLRLDKDNELKYLERMMQKGWALKSFCAGVHTFEPCEPGEYIYQIDFTEKLFDVTDEYREFMEEQGIEIVCNWGPWTYLRRKASEGEFNLYTDVESTIEHYKKIRKMFKIVTIFELLIFIYEMCVGAFFGSTSAYVAALIIGIVIIIFMNALVRVHKTIGELYERIGEENCYTNRKMNPFLWTGMMCNSLGLIFRERVGDTVQIIILIVAIVLMLVGIAQSAATYKQSK